MITLQQHLLNNVTAIRKEAEQRAAEYNLSVAEAIEQVIDGWTEGYYDAMSDAHMEESSAWSDAFERNDEHRQEMEDDEARFGPFDPWGEFA